ncbi:amino acid adenylation domain-containing protein [Streptomyces sp. XM4193]|uniref:amino acid adenylation domain-containing protein n=1 Tax=Streptomyces sp. XM4193 TaxID=2929782 RepID=UPI001FFA5A31|nr:amino acid adenylation domain-containing protein [Streptomyces sp. XM4193]MCK1795228.1 amino acid adenylation domain-containing protein [Streptomyces sp. XM4193]
MATAPRTVAAGIIAHAAREPRRIALTTPDGDVEYGRLAADIEELARYLRAEGVGPETVCAVAVDPGAHAVTAMAAVNHAGAAFLTVDIGQPPERLAAFTRTAGATVLLTTSDVAPRLDLDLPALLLDRLPPRSADSGRYGTGDRPGTGPAEAEGPVHPRALAYVSHTSGSTGEPSTVLIEHRSLNEYLHDTARAFELGPDTVALAMAPLGYDASIRDTLVPLLAGGRLVLAERSQLLRPEAFVRTLRTHRITALLSVTPSFLSHLAGQPAPADPLAGVALVASSGESLRPFLAAGGRRLVHGRLINQYGPTECTMTTTRFAVPSGTSDTAASGPAASDTAAGAGPAAESGSAAESGPDIVGTARAGTLIRLLDDRLLPVAPGEVGEVCIGGTGLARGYRDRPARTAECFVPDPCGPPGARLYRTGDFGRLDPDGRLEYLGRTDRQVKIRGYRVDPAEIEGALLAHPLISGAVVTAHHDEQGRVHLVAHLAGELDDVPDSALRGHLLRLLPPHLMPRRFLRMDVLPTTRGGKADRRALAGGAGAPTGGGRP